MKVLVFALLLICLATAFDFQGTVEEQFTQFKQVFEKSYKSPVEEQMRFQIFQQSVETAKRMTQDTNGVTQFGITQFSDLTKEEFSHLYLMKKTPKFEIIQGHENTFNNTGDENKAWDWRYVKSIKNGDTWSGCVTPVYNQGQCGSCWAFSATEEIESMTCLQGYESLVQLSMQQIVDCTTTCYGCNGGWTYLAYEGIISNDGGDLDTYASYPYTCQDGSCTFNAANTGAAISGWSYVGRGNEATMLGFIQSTGPLSICVDASTWQYYTGGVVTCAACGNSLDHCVQLTGYGSFQGQNTWVVRNSWGTSWGYSGYLYVQYGCNACGINCVPTTVQGKSPSPIAF